MSSDPKYVILDGYPVILHNAIFHNTIQVTDNMKSPEAISAGFVGFDPEKKEFYCYGESVSLNLKSKPEEDSIKINKMFNPYYDWDKERR